VAHLRELARQSAAGISFDLAFVAAYAVVELEILGFVPPWVTALAVGGGLPWLLLTIKVLGRLGLGQGGGPLSVQLDLPGARLFAGILVLFTWPLALLIPLLVYAAMAQAAAAAFVGPRGLIALNPWLGVPITAVGIGYLALVGILFAARSPKTKEESIPDFDPKRLLRITLPLGCGVIGLAVGHLGGNLDQIGMPTDILVLLLYLPFRYLIERVGGITWISALVSMCAVGASVALPLIL
jgi:hypothetical protein